ncbi:RnfABCDGE type electron transport complex subunit A [Traorella massiliensis]|uniref:electron transport complex protein RnfA n=1 Tax=Traorella massiliensis TaxID=1903263 RepID=UPI00248EFD0E|nr:RnfABCDGE type electron transport complex subunit A [Traorella massiliensis]
MSELFTLFLGAAIINNIILTRFLGMCPFLGVSKKVDSALGMGAAVTFVIFVSSIVTYTLYYQVLEPAGLEYMDLITFILVIAAFVQLVEMIIKKFSPALYKALGIYLPLITTNCAVLGVALDNISNGYDFVEMCTYSLAVPIGFALVLFIFSTIRERLDTANTQPSFKGNPIALIVAGLMALAFSGLAGLV